MSKGFNQVIIIGRLTRDVELRSTSTGKSVTEASLAVDKGQDQTAFFDVTFWDKTAELVSQYTKKGSKILIQGRLDQQTWDDKETGKKRSKVVIVAFDVTFLDSKQESQQQGELTQWDALQNAPAQPRDLDKPVSLSDVPF